MLLKPDSFVYFVRYFLFSNKNPLATFAFLKKKKNIKQHIS